MSDDKKKTARRANDDYQTPIGVVSPLLALIDWPRVRSFLEPCAGQGRIIRAAGLAAAVTETFHGSLATARSWKWCEIEHGVDYLETKCEPVDLIITNPPFTLALEFLRKSLEEAATVCYLLPLGFLSSTERRDFWRANPPTNLYTVSARPCFVWVCTAKECKGSADPAIADRGCPDCGARMKRQTDFSDVGWYVWDRGRFLTSRAPFGWL